LSIEFAHAQFKAAYSHECAPNMENATAPAHQQENHHT